MIRTTIKSLTQQVNQVISYSQNISIEMIDSTDWMHQWFNSKKSFIQKFGDIIYEYPTPIKLTLSEKERMHRVSEFCDLLDEYNGDLANFVYEFKDNFYQNITTKPYETLEGVIIPKGSKIIRAFKYFITDKEILTDLQNQASMLVQEDKICGILCLSVHPLDFLSSSENTYNWRSCHALDGDYRVGNISYMLDNATCVCYIKGEEETALPDFPPEIEWNSKKWRMLIHTNFDNQIFFCGRQYPFFSEAALVMIRDILLELFADDENYSSWQIAERTADAITINATNIGLNDIVKDSPPHLHYNDILLSTVYQPYYIYNTKIVDKPHPLTVGAAPLCPCCHTKPLLEGSMFICDDCAEYVELSQSAGHCEICGKDI